MTVQDMFDKINAWEWDEIKAASKFSAADAKSVNRIHAIQRKYNKMRQNATQMVYKAINQ